MSEELDAATPEARRKLLVELYREVSRCSRCSLHETRTRVVFGAGNADADLVFVGEAPGAEEDRRGMPFVGRAGKLLEELLAGIGLRREDVFITNVLKSRPPRNRDPRPEEIEACSPYLDRQLALIRPTVVATLGNFSTRLITGNPAGITRVRGTPQTHTLGGREVLVFPLLHPAAALRTPAMRITLTEDFDRLHGLLQAPPPASEAASPAQPAGNGAAAVARGPDGEQLDIFRAPGG